jgi:hypothetical protein
MVQAAPVQLRTITLRQKRRVPLPIAKRHVIESVEAAAGRGAPVDEQGVGENVHERLVCVEHAAVRVCNGRMSDPSDQRLSLFLFVRAPLADSQ